MKTSTKFWLLALAVLIYYTLPYVNLPALKNLSFEDWLFNDNSITYDFIHYVIKAIFLVSLVATVLFIVVALVPLINKILDNK